MKIIKSTLLKRRKCEYGDFKLSPDEGWKLSHTFIDFGSKLLIVTVSVVDRSKWINNGYNGWSIPTKEYKIDLKSLRVLDQSEWKKYFNYDKIEIISEDRKYKLISQRFYKPEQDSDGIKEELFNLATGEKISSSTSIAFQNTKHENLLEDLYESIKKKEEEKRILDNKPTLEQFYQIQLKRLKENDIIIGYFNDVNTYKLSFTNSTFELYQGGKLPAQQKELKSLKFHKLKTYSTVDVFWEEFTQNKKWFLDYHIHQGIAEHPLVLAKHIHSFFNDLRKEHHFTYAEYDHVIRWSNPFWSDEYKETEIKQWCSHCYKEVRYQGRYPKYICGECFSKDKMDLKGNYLEFSNLDFSGGFKITYTDKAGTTLKEDDTRESCDFTIEGKNYFAEEAKFGGIVIQKKE